MERCWQGKTEVLRDKPVPVPVCPIKTSHGLLWDGTRATAVRGRPLTAWATYCIISSTSVSPASTRNLTENTVNTPLFLRPLFVPHKRIWYPGDHGSLGVTVTKDITYLLIPRVLNYIYIYIHIYIYPVSSILHTNVWCRLCSVLNAEVCRTTPSVGEPDLKHF